MNITFFPCVNCGKCNSVESETWKLQVFDQKLNRFVESPTNLCGCGENIESKTSFTERSNASATEVLEKEKAIRDKNCECDAIIEVKRQTAKVFHRTINREKLKQKKEDLKKEGDDTRIAKNLELARLQEEAKLKKEQEEKAKLEEPKNK